MKCYLLLLSIAIFASCSNKKSETPPIGEEQVTGEFDWLLGIWERSNDDEGKKTFEHWKIKSTNEYVGFSCTMIKQDTVWKENILLIQVNGSWEYQVRLAEGSESTNFKLTDKSASSFVCENPENDFPRTIEYRVKNEEMVATISGGGPEVSFIYAAKSPRKIETK